MAKVACMVMLKNERTMTPRFLAYHAALFGAENVYAFDNGSADPEVLAELERFESMGVHVDRSYRTTGDFHRKAIVLGDLVRRLERASDYDFYVPLDCDEFVALRKGGGFTADPDEIHAYLDGLRGSRDILRVTVNLANLLGEPDVFRPTEYSRTVWPPGVFHFMDHGYHTGIAVGGESPYCDCELVYAHFHYRPYEEVVEFAKQKLRVELSDEEIEDHARLREFRGIGWHMVHYLVDGAEAYYRQFRDPSGTVSFPNLSERFAALGIEAPFFSFRLPPSEAAAAPHLVVDEASTARVRGWALDPAAPEEPLSLRFLVDGGIAWEGVCDGIRLDVRDAGHAVDRVGFDFRLAIPPGPGPHALTVEGKDGARLRMLVGGRPFAELLLEHVPAPADAGRASYSHIDSFRNGRVQGWVLRTVPTPERTRLLGGCTIALVHRGRVVAQATADLPRKDVADATGGEERCGFALDVPRALLSEMVLRVFVMPDMLELNGSPCVASAGLQPRARAFAAASRHASRPEPGVLA